MVFDHERKLELEIDEFGWGMAPKDEDGNKQKTGHSKFRNAPNHRPVQPGMDHWFGKSAEDIVGKQWKCKERRVDTQK
jgi:hypothetical protein